MDSHDNNPLLKWDQPNWSEEAAALFFILINILQIGKNKWCRNDNCNRETDKSCSNANTTAKHTQVTPIKNTCKL